jgi:ribosomal protein L11 methyltransferase
MKVFHIECSAVEKDQLVAELWERGTLGITEQDLPGGRVRLSGYFAEEVSLPGGVWEEVEDRDWVAVSQSQWSPMLVGARFFLVPAWSDEPAPAGRLRITMNPGQACGTGWHAATQLCLEAVERHLTPGAAVLDVGTGSGILAVAASLLGAGSIIACDIDPEALRAAQQRLREEHVSAGLFQGSPRSLRAACADLVVANINAETLISLAPDLHRVRHPSGRLILSGFPRRHLERMRAAFPGSRETLEKQEWAALVC